VIDVAGCRTTAASRILAGNLASRDATAVERLRAAGAVVVGKLNTHEFAYGALTTSPHFGPARNPWALDRVCGGSSGGSGAATAADLAAGTLGTDTAGSIRIPACFCGVTGLRPTTGRVPNRGVVPVAWTFDTVGPIARSAEDCALLLEAVAGADPADPSTASVPVPRYREALTGELRGLTVGVVSRLFEGRIDARIAALCRAALAELEALGARLEPVELELLDQLGTIQQAMQFPEAAAAHLGWLRTRLADYGDDVRARLLTGLFLPPTAYVLGQRARRLVYEGFRRVMERVDLLVAPTMPVLPPRIGEETVTIDGESVPYRLTLIPYNSPWSCVGAPVASVPCGFLEGLPVGLAIAGRRFDEATVLRAAHAYQTRTDWHERRPQLSRAGAAAG
jgi:aspartyl-tRNA(Asn)/glutamyl-tRNA(Gln) amidotransferase subunit A